MRPLGVRPSVVATCAPSFRADYIRASPAVRHSVLVGVQRIEKLLNGQESTAKSQTRRIRGIRPEYEAWRFRLSDKDRLVYSTCNGLRLIRFGDHDTTQDCVRKQHPLFRDRDCSSDIPFSHLAKHSGLFPTNIDEVYAPNYESDAEPSWIFYLDEEQTRIAEEIIESVLSFSDDGESTTHWIVGGPGTGKSAILASLADLLRNNPRFELKLRWPIPVLVQALTGMPFNLVPLIEQLGDEGGSRRRVLLVDDPARFSDLAALNRRSSLARKQMHICAFDPLQFREAIQDRTFTSLVKNAKIIVHRLSVSYRQRAAVAQAAHALVSKVAESTPFLDSRKIQMHRAARRELTELANTMTFPHPDGSAIELDYRNEKGAAGILATILPPQERCWKHWPPFLFVYADEVKASYQEFLTSLQTARPIQVASMPSGYLAGYGLENRVKESILESFTGEMSAAWEVPLSSVELMKGLEFQAVILVIDRSEYQAIANGFRGSGQSAYEHRRLMRIPLTRARDCLAIVTV